VGPSRIPSPYPHSCTCARSCRGQSRSRCGASVRRFIHIEVVEPRRGGPSGWVWAAAAAVVFVVPTGAKSMTMLSALSVKRATTTRLPRLVSGRVHFALPALRLLSTRLPRVSQAWVEPVRSLLEAPSPAVLTTYRTDGSAHTVPVWYRWTGDAFEVVIARGDVKLRHLARDPRCVLVVFEAVRPFRGMEVGGWPSWWRVTSRRRGLGSLAAISGWKTASASPPNGGPAQGCSCGSSPTALGYGTCRESCHPDRPLRAPRRHPDRVAASGLGGDLRPQAPTVVHHRYLAVDAASSPDA